MFFMIFSPVADIVPIRMSDNPVTTVYTSSMISPTMKRAIPRRSVRVIQFGMRRSQFICTALFPYPWYIIAAALPVSSIYCLAERPFSQYCAFASRSVSSINFCAAIPFSLYIVFLVVIMFHSPVRIAQYNMCHS